LEEDLAAMYHNDPAARSQELILSCYPGIRAIRTYRIAHELHKLGLPNIARMMTELAHAETGIDIHPGATIGRRFAVDHGTGTVIGETTVIGNDVLIYQGVTLGARKFERDEHSHVRRDDKQRHPTIKDGVILYANATVMGGDTVIGERTVIAAGATVKESVEADMIVWPGSTTQTSRFKNRARVTNELIEERQFGERDDAYWFEIYRANLERCDDN
jgi:serine O-acetyltransferase